MQPLVFCSGLTATTYVSPARIMKGASEYAGGNLAYKIDVTSDDEMGYLAKTLNYMSDELNKKRRISA